MAKVYRRSGETIDDFVSRFNEIVKREGILRKFKQAQVFQTKAEKTAEKQARAAKLREFRKKASLRMPNKARKRYE